jgi:hypothetical protein
LKDHDLTILNEHDAAVIGDFTSYRVVSEIALFRQQSMRAAARAVHDLMGEAGISKPNS